MYPIALTAQAVCRQESLVITEDLSPTTYYYSRYILFTTYAFQQAMRDLQKKNYSLANFFNATTVAREPAVHQMVSGL